MKQLILDEKNAKALFGNADKDFKQMLIDTFGEEFFSQKITDRIKTFEDACQDNGLDPHDVLPFHKPTNARQEAANAFAKLDIISESLLEGARLDWTDSSQQKWYPWFNNYQPGSGFRFDGALCGWTYAGTFGGARLCVDTQEKARYFGTQFLEIWNKFLNPNK